MITSQLRRYLEGKLGFDISNLRPVAGGDINETFAFTAGQIEHFIKIQNSPEGLNMFRSEEAGLRAIEATNAILVPKVYFTGIVDRQAFLLMEYVNFRRANDADWAELGRKLARMHKSKSAHYGLDHDNYIGTLIQSNKHCASWSEFYADCRIEPQLSMASNLLNSSDLKNWDRLRQRLNQVLAPEHPSLIHGDLWSGNVQISDDGPIVYDPAISFADREMDLAMSRLFGGFPPTFYASYDEAFPIESSGMEERVEIYQLYYLLVHVNLFGMSYVPAVRRILQRFS